MAIHPVASLASADVLPLHRAEERRKRFAKQSIRHARAAEVGRFAGGCGYPDAPAAVASCTSLSRPGPRSGQHRIAGPAQSTRGPLPGPPRKALSKQGKRATPQDAPAATLRRSQPALRLVVDSLNRTAGGLPFSGGSARPLAACRMGMQQQPSATARSGVVPHNPNGRWRWPVVSQVQGGKSAVTNGSRCAAVVRQSNPGHRSGNWPRASAIFKSKTCCAGALQRVPEPAYRRVHNKVAEPGRTWEGGARVETKHEDRSLTGPGQRSSRHGTEAAPAADHRHRLHRWRTSSAPSARGSQTLPTAGGESPHQHATGRYALIR